MPKKRSPSPDTVVRTLRLRLKDKHAAMCRSKSYWVNQVFNYCNELSYKVFQRERRFMSGYDFAKYTKGASKEMPLHSQTIQAISEEYATRRKQFKKVKLRWRKSAGSKRSLGWIPFKASAIHYRNGQLWLSGFDQPLSLWDSYGLSNYELGAGSIAEDTRGRWYINITVKVKKQPPSLGKADLGIDLGLKDLASFSDPALQNIEAQQFYRDLGPKLAVAQRANKKRIIKTIHAKIAHRRKDQLHQLSTKLIKSYGAIFVGNVNSQQLAKTGMAKSVLDAGWGMFRTMLQYKGDDAGTWVQEINEAYSTQDCSACDARSGPKGLKDLGIREWTCSQCGTVHHRDRNAANNILRRGRATLAVGIPVVSAQAAAVG
jgi:putative transposase